MTKHENDGSFSRFQQRELMLGTETVSVTEYKGFEIQIRTYNGVSAKIYGRKGDKRYCLRLKGFNFMQVEVLLQKQKEYINEYSDRLNEKLAKKNNSK